MADEGAWRPPDDGEDEEDEVDETNYKHAKDAVIFAIEISPGMLAIPPADAGKTKRTDQLSAAAAALKCAYALMQQRIIASPSDMMAVLLYGTEQTKFQDDGDVATGTLSYPNCYLLVDLNVPSAEDVKALRGLVDGESVASPLVAATERVPMSNVLFCANQIFTTRTPNFASRRLFIVTDDDDPHRTNSKLKSAAAVRARDLYDLGVVIELFPISKPGHDFDRSKFYSDIIYDGLPQDPEAPVPTSGESAPASVQDGISLLSSLLSAVHSKAVARRALFSSMPLEIGPDFRISVRGYILYKRQEPKRSCYISLEGEKAQIAIGSSTQIAEDTARTVEKIEVRKAFKFGGAQITFTPEEVSSLRNFGEPMIRILGFKPASMLPIWANTRPATFLYPSEQDFVGSTRVFAALQQKLLADNLIGLAWFIARKNAVPVIAAIIPGPERIGEKGEQTNPPGLWLAPLPFADDIRQNPEITSVVRAPDSLTDKMGQVVKNLMLPKERYDPARYHNPALQWHYRILQAIALEDELPDVPEDTTIPKYRAIDKRVGDLALDWGKELHIVYEESLSRTQSDDSKGSKRTHLAIHSGTKKVKTAHAAAEISDEQMMAAVESGSLSKMTLVDLRAWLHQHSLSISGNKPDLIKRVETLLKG